MSEVNEARRRIRGRKTPANSHHATLSLTQQVGTPDSSLRGDLVKPVADLLGDTESHMHRRAHIRVQVGPAGEVFTGLEADELGASLREALPVVVNIFSVEVDITAVGYGGWAITEVNRNKSGHECLLPSPKDSWHHMENQEDWFSTAGIDGFDGCNFEFNPPIVHTNPVVLDLPAVVCGDSCWRRGKDIFCMSAPVRLACGRQGEGKDRPSSGLT